MLPLSCPIKTSAFGKKMAILFLSPSLNPSLSLLLHPVLYALFLEEDVDLVELFLNFTCLARFGNIFFNLTHSC